MKATQSANPLVDDATLLKGYADQIRATGKIDPALYEKYNVKRGLRNADGTGVLVGLTCIGSVHGYMISESEKVSVPGQLFYRGINVSDLVNGFQSEKRFGFEESAYLLLFGELPDARELKTWNDLLDSYRRLPDGFKEGAIIRSPGKDIMNSIARAVLMAYTYDPEPDKLDIETTLRQSIELIAQFPTIAAYAYQAKAHYHMGQSLMMRYPEKGKGTAENFLMLTREDGMYTQLEAELLDLCLVLHAEHGGGNNSAFTTHVVTSSFTDSYAAIAAATLSLKGPRHGGANLRVMSQMREIKEHVEHWDSEGEVADYLTKILNKEAGDGTGLIYGLGHAVYTLSDPRTDMLREKARTLAKAKGRDEEMALYEMIEQIGPRIFNKNRAKPRDLCANVDFYSGFVYDMLNIPIDLYTPIFAISRVVGWCAHRMEELLNGGPIIRPAYKAIFEQRPYRPMEERK
ncbi:MAG TPA: citrate/2-methylcitrate synthase [Kiritimatiellia bacterium]|nr:citrate/2-methylcitrate synthase [Kiritimatiellia bacterium]HPS09611.1 citrate/2-methylcitrate synthase [Kiritimatiellia bacterium]